MSNFNESAEGYEDRNSVELDLSRDIALEREEESHRLVPAISGRLEHARIGAVDHRDVPLPAILRRRLGDAPCAGAAVHPDVLDAEVRASRIVSSATRAWFRLRPRRRRQDHDLPPLVLEGRAIADALRELTAEADG